MCAYTQVYGTEIVIKSLQIHICFFFWLPVYSYYYTITIYLHLNEIKIRSTTRHLVSGYDLLPPTQREMGTVSDHKWQQWNRFSHSLLKYQRMCAYHCGTY